MAGLHYIQLKANFFRFHEFRREREGLLHKFESYDVPPMYEDPYRQNRPKGKYNNASRNGHSYNRRQLPRADVSKTIKSFSRSAAGQDKTRPEDLRPAHVLKYTVSYLCQKYV